MLLHAEMKSPSFKSQTKRTWLPQTYPGVSINNQVMAAL